MTVLDKLRRNDSGLTGREEERIRETVRAECAVPGERFAVERYQPELAGRLHHAAAVKASRKERTTPWRATGATALLGYGGWGAGWLAELVVGPVGHMAATGGTAVVGGGLAIALSILGRRHRRWAGSHGVAAGLGAVWATLTAAFGPWWGGPAEVTTPLVAALPLAGGAAVATSWRRDPTPVAAPAPRVVEAPTGPTRPVSEPSPVDDFARRWAEMVRNQKLELTGCLLTDGRDAGNVLEYTLQLAGGRTLGKVRDKQAVIAAALHIDPMQLTFAHLPPRANGFRDTSKVAVQYILSSPITGPVYFTEPRFTLTDDGHGQADLGPCVDGQRTGRYELFRPSGMFSGVAIGSTGKGKSSVVNGIVVSARSSRGAPFRDSAAQGVVTLYLDPKGNSSPDLAKHATIPVVGLDRAELFTSCVEELVHWLGKKASLDGRSVYTPDYRVGYLIVIDECDMLFALRGMADRWGTIAKTGRSYGVGLLLATQYAGLKAFGNSDLLRSSIRAGNVILMRTESNTSDGLIAPDLPKSTTLPSKPGYLYLKNQAELAGAVRGSWLLTSDEPIPAGFPAELRGWNAAAALAKYPDAPLCPIGRRALAPLLEEGDQEERQRVRAEQLRGEIGAYLRGEVRSLSPAAREIATDLGIDGLAARFAALPGPMADVIPLHRDTPAVDVSGLRLGVNARAVLEVMLTRHGAWGTGALVDAIGKDAPSISKGLAELRDRGLAVNPTHGQWTLTEQGRRVAA